MHPNTKRSTVNHTISRNKLIIHFLKWKTKNNPREKILDYYAIYNLINQCSLSVFPTKRKLISRVNEARSKKKLGMQEVQKMSH